MLRFVVALAAESKPLVARYRLRLEPETSAFKIYRREETWLTLSGPGKTAAAAATAYLHLASGGHRHAVWLNVGIAGHTKQPAGEALIAHKIFDRSSGRAWYPPQTFVPSCASDVLTTVDQPEREFTSPGAFDMEASGFYATACRFASAELVQCLKIVSDGPGESPEQLSAERVSSLVEARLDLVESVGESCLSLAEELRKLDAEPPDLELCLERWRFSVSERHELKRQLRRRQTLAPEQDLPLAGLDRSLRGKEINRRLRVWLDALPVG